MELLLTGERALTTRSSRGTGHTSAELAAIAVPVALLASPRSASTDGPVLTIHGGA